MKKLTVTCEDGSRYEGELDDTQVAEIEDGALKVAYPGEPPFVLKLPSPAVEMTVGDIES